MLQYFRYAKACHRVRCSSNLHTREYFDLNFILIRELVEQMLEKIGVVTEMHRLFEQYDTWGSTVPGGNVRRHHDVIKLTH